MECWSFGILGLDFPGNTPSQLEYKVLSRFHNAPSRLKYYLISIHIIFLCSFFNTPIITNISELHHGHTSKLILTVTGSCMALSNVTSPVLFTSIALPIVRDLGRTSNYARTLLIGLAFSCNIGGILTPISSPENMYILGYLEERELDHAVSWIGWMSIAIPFGIIALITLWLYLILFVLQERHEDDGEGDEGAEKVSTIVIPPIVYDAREGSSRDYVVVFTTVLSIVLWCTLNYTRDIFGDTATIALLPLVILFGSGVLVKNSDMSSFRWHLVLLIGAGNVLGLAVQNSRLLHLITHPLVPFLENSNVWLTVVTVLVLILVLTSFIPHTVAALILTPIIVSVGKAIHHTHSLIFASTFMLHLTMSLPISTIPNINSWLVDDHFARPFLHANELMRHGIIVTLIMFVELSTIGYAIFRFAFGKSVW